ncbi:unnamed protein product [Lupinus luteus]|uniref:MIR domain-containing protein n=1 Tax=Lupinus luteus TaxID=3873 RepID=A0AAV1W8L8_LUPLU
MNGILEQNPAQHGIRGNPGRTVAPSGSQSVYRRKTTSSSQTTGSTRLVYRESIKSPETEFLSLDSDTPHSPTSSVSAASSEGVEVEISYGSVLKLMHEKTRVRLHSHEVPYGSGSGQQSVTGFPGVDGSNSYWIVKPQLESSAKQGDTIKSGTIIRLQHMRTRKWLHSHLHASPYQPILRLTTEGSGKTWKQDQKIRLQHVDTGGYLHSHDKKYTRITGGQQEFCGVHEKRAGSK